MERREFSAFEAAPDRRKEDEPAFRAEIRPISEVKPLPGEKLKRFPWPLELQGKGEYRRDDGTYVVRYPRGDVFLSYITIIHELGHPRQHELNQKITAGGAQTHENLYGEEQDAWERGWPRFTAANPALVAALEQRFASFKARGQFADFERLESLYAWVRENALKMVEVQRVLFEGETVSGEAERFDLLADEMEKAGIEDFLGQYARLRVGERVDEREVEGAIENCLRLINKELPHSGDI